MQTKGEQGARNESISTAVDKIRASNWTFEFAKSDVSSEMKTQFESAAPKSGGKGASTPDSDDDCGQNGVYEIGENEKGNDEKTIDEENINDNENCEDENNENESKNGIENDDEIEVGAGRDESESDAEALMRELLRLYGLDDK